MKTETVSYQCGETTCLGHLAYDDSQSGQRPCVIIAHAWKGLDNFVREKAKALVELGYVAFAADLYGNGSQPESNDEAGAMMMPLFLDRKLLRERIVSAYETAAGFDQTDPKKMGAMGFCFGGLTVIELLRSGADLQGVVSFHGLLGHTLGEMNAPVIPNAKKLKGSLLILHGNDDPMVPSDDVVSIQKEMTNAEVDWQMHIYGNTTHAFTNPAADDAENGMLYNPVAEKRSLQAMNNFFTEVML